MSTKPPIKLDDRLGSAKVKAISQSQLQSETRVKSGKVRPPSAKSRPPSSRAKSRQDSQRPGSRTRSRAGSRMEGWFFIFFPPSFLLSILNWFVPSTCTLFSTVNYNNNEHAYCEVIFVNLLNVRNYIHNKSKFATLATSL
jgi:hypothetical protein